ncbi:LLM class F420-dependent oxidoreductase [Enemella evansiae]|uniref:LLM class F420-dependent oxidoreductase n=1 Tax=Enemella evansiae TaxID=2016499 RepID=A0A255GJ27_9ACTN|nr:LLM class F420-dependent oxidoreductase [Enemella evansiae]PFG68010.1 F420-dependent oxidoreductase-like protein [Propionibacteriaceae bacterium ES.041]OYN95791.1 LLM class F420-dependent oxidoreductase [Enemella evansiae]OYO01565.1 LLM class F420-dependent oxidoreductase [Enemella evansiae]OYO04001.1 LLM class F420-dependent oxidoreductase [Enemella evansiae]OYO08311.1 LLM class F420-dependent oxidoreductase [Enemella evansiae]
MEIGMPLNYSGGFREAADELLDFEAAGLGIVMMPEAYSFDAVSALGYLAARTERVRLASGILNVYSRTPALLAMTAAGLDHVSDGRFVLGIGASGPQVVEGFHGLRYDAPLGRTREVAEICRMVWRREPLQYAGKYYTLPLDAEHGGSGLGKPLKLINHPLRERIPMVLAAIGPKNVALAAELFEGWQPVFFAPEHAEAAFGDSLAAGRAKRAPELGELQILVDTTCCITDDERLRAKVLAGVRDHVALYVGGMGAKGKNFYNALAVRYGYADAAAEIQDRYLAGDKQGAAAAVPEDLLHQVALVGDADHVAKRVRAFADAGVTTLNVQPIAGDHAGRVATVEALAAMAR